MRRLSKDVTKRATWIACLAASLGCASARAGPAENGDTRAPVPDEQVQQKGMEMLREIFARQYEEAKTAAEKAELAGELLQQADKTKCDPADRFVLLRSARDLGVQGGAVDTALEATERIVAEFRVEPIETKGLTLIALADHAESKAGNRRLADTALEVINAALDAGRIDLARQLAERAAPAALKGNDVPLYLTLDRRRQLANLAADVAPEYQKALETLRTKPQDPQANLVAGRYRCLIANDWTGGIPMLAAGGDEALKALAQKELAKAGTLAEERALADGWWELAAARSGYEQIALRRRAAAWYTLAIRELSGIERFKMQQRIDGVPPPVPPIEASFRRIDPKRYYGEKKILLIFGGHGEPEVAKAACDKYGLTYDWVKKFDKDLEDYGPYHTIICGSNAVDYWGGKETRKPEAFQHIRTFVEEGGHLIVLGSWNGRHTGHLKQFGISTSFNHNKRFAPAGEVTDILFLGNEEIIPEDRHLQSVGNFEIDAPHTVLLRRGEGHNARRPALATLKHGNGRVTYACVEPYYGKDYWLITVLLSWVSRGCPT